MKDKAFLLLLLLSLLPLGAEGQAAILQFGNNVQFNPGTFQFGQSVKPERLPEPRGDVLEFVDGSSLHGSLAGVDLENGLTWAAPQAAHPIHFRPDHIDFLRFARSQSVAMTPTCHLWFGNGDDLYGSLSSLDDKKLTFNTWFGGTMAIPRSAVRAITFLSPNYSVAYEGPYDTGGWEVVNNSPKCWSYRDNAFIGAGAGMLGRDLSLTNSSTVEFDLAWNGSFSLEVGVYCDVSERMDFNAGSSIVSLTPQKVALGQMRGMGVPYGGSAEVIPGGPEKNRMHVAIECDKTEGTVSVFINHDLIKTWKDCNFTGGGSGVIFMLPAMYLNATVKLSHLKITQWQGRSEPETAATSTNSDAMYFINHDHATGKIESIQDGKARLALPTMALDVPLERVTRMEFAQTQVPSESPSPWRVRAHFPGGGSLSFQLDKWNDKGVSGQSAIFGPLAFQPDAIREMEFNLNRPKEDGVVAETKEFEELDE